MKFEITHTSNRTDLQPCEEATPGEETSNGYPTWVVEIDDLEQLLAFIAKYKSVVIDAHRQSFTQTPPKEEKKPSQTFITKILAEKLIEFTFNSAPDTTSLPVPPDC